MNNLFMHSSLEDIINQFKFGKTDAFTLTKDIVHQLAEIHFDDTRIDDAELIMMFKQYNQTQISKFDADIKRFIIEPCYSIVHFGLSSFYPLIKNSSYHLDVKLHEDLTVDIKITYL